MFASFAGFLSNVAVLVVQQQRERPASGAWSAVMGGPGHVSGTSISTAQYVGWRFETSRALTIDHVGGHFLSIPDVPGDIFATIVRLPSITSVPAGAPFNPDEIVATTTFRPPFPSARSFHATLHNADTWRLHTRLWHRTVRRHWRSCRPQLRRPARYSPDRPFLVHLLEQPLLRPAS